jgi:hypothetical protein
VPEIDRSRRRGKTMDEADVVNDRIGKIGARHVAAEQHYAFEARTG